MTLPRVYLAAFLASLLFAFAGCSEQKAAGPPAGKTGDEWTVEDFAGSESDLAMKGGPEFIEFCSQKGTCEIKGDVLDKFKGILKKYPVANEDEYDHFAVVVREGLIEKGMVQKGDPDRYQYSLRMLIIPLTSE